MPFKDKMAHLLELTVCKSALQRAIQKLKKIWRQQIR